MRNFTFPTGNNQPQPPLAEFWRGKSSRRFFSRRVLIGLIFLLIFIILGGGVTILAVNKKIKTAFEFGQTRSSGFQPLLTKAPTITLLPTSPQPQQPDSKHLPASCLEDPNSQQCRQQLQEILDKECGGNLEAPACAPYFQEAVVLQTVQECKKDPSSLMCRCLKEKDPGECLGQEIRSKTFGVLFCELAKQPFLGKSFVKLCQQFGGSTSTPNTSPSDQLNCQVEPNKPDCQVYFETNCSADPYAIGCENYCLENPQAPVCLQRCQTDLTIPGCQELLSTYCPAYPYQPECAAYFETTCPQEIYNIGCIQYCQQNPYSQGCVGFLLNYCRGNLSDTLCMSVLCERAPQLCSLCQQFPNLCNQLYQ